MKFVKNTKAKLTEKVSNIKKAVKPNKKKAVKEEKAVVAKQTLQELNSAIAIAEERLAEAQAKTLELEAKAKTLELEAKAKAKEQEAIKVATEEEIVEEILSVDPELAQEGFNELADSIETEYLRVLLEDERFSNLEDQEAMAAAAEDVLNYLASKMESEVK